MPLRKVGTCGLPRPKAELSALFSVAEVQQTFYQPPQIKTLERWRAEVPDQFEFTLKAWQLITHEAKSPTYRKLRTKLTTKETALVGSFRTNTVVRNAWQVTAHCAKVLRADKVLFQTPASFGPSSEHLENLRGFFSSIAREGLSLLWEPRGPAWEEELITALCEELELIHVVDPFVRCSVTPNFLYYRLHGRGGYRYRYEDIELSDLAESLPKNRPCYVMFNNVYMLEDAAHFQAMLLAE